MLHQLKLILNFNQGLALLNRSLSLINTKISKKKTMKISVLNYLMLAYISLTATFLPPHIKKILDHFLEFVYNIRAGIHVCAPTI